jgi:hypothetical protein
MRRREAEGKMRRNEVYGLAIGRCGLRQVRKRERVGVVDEDEDCGKQGPQQGRAKKRRVVVWEGREGRRECPWQMPASHTHLSWRRGSSAR